MFKPEFVHNIYCYGAANRICADMAKDNDPDFTTSEWRRLYWLISGKILTSLFGWWWCEYEYEDLESIADVD